MEGVMWAREVSKRGRTVSGRTKVGQTNEYPLFPQLWEFDGEGTQNDSPELS